MHDRSGSVDPGPHNFNPSGVAKLTKKLLTVFSGQTVRPHVRQTKAHHDIADVLHIPRAEVAFDRRLLGPGHEFDQRDALTDSATTHCIWRVAPTDSI